MSNGPQVRKAWVGWWVDGSWCPTRKIRDHRIKRLTSACYYSSGRPPDPAHDVPATIVLSSTPDIHTPVVELGAESLGALAKALRGEPYDAPEEGPIYELNRTTIEAIVRAVGEADA